MTAASAVAEAPDDPPDAAGILDDCVSLIGADIKRIRDLVAPTGRVLTGEEARILAGYARALVDVSRARKAARDDDDLTDQDKALLSEIEKLPAVAELLKRGEGR